MTIRILLADDHPVVRAGLRALLATVGDIEIVGEAGTADAAVEAVAAGGIDLVLMDLRFGRGEEGGVEATRRILALAEPPRVLIVTNHETDADILGAVEAGASGYILKDADPADLVAAVRAACAGGSALSPSVERRLSGRGKAPGTALSLREVEVLQLVAAGLSNREIGERLFLSEATVKSHLAHVFGKLGVRSRTRAVARAREQGIF